MDRDFKILNYTASLRPGHPASQRQQEDSKHTKLQIIRWKGGGQSPPLHRPSLACPDASVIFQGVTSSKTPPWLTLSFKTLSIRIPSAAVSPLGFSCCLDMPVFPLSPENWELEIPNMLETK